MSRKYRTVPHKPSKICDTCPKMLPIGEGDHICDEDPTKMVLEDYIIADDYCWCKGKYWVKN